MENKMPSVLEFARQRNFIKTLDKAFRMQLANTRIDLAPILRGLAHAN